MTRLEDLANGNEKIRIALLVTGIAARVLMGIASIVITIALFAGRSVIQRVDQAVARIDKNADTIADSSRQLATIAEHDRMTDARIALVETRQDKQEERYDKIAERLAKIYERQGYIARGEYPLPNGESRR